MTSASVNLLGKTENTIVYELIYIAIKCDVNSCLYREYSSYLSLCNNIIAFPLIIFTSILSIVSTMQTIEIEDEENSKYLHTNSNIKICIAFLSILVAIMSSLQKYCKYAERSEITKNYAKNFEKLGYNIEFFLYEIKNDSITTETESFDKLVNNIFKEFEVLVTECDEQPCNMANKQCKLFNKKSEILLKKEDNSLTPQFPTTNETDKSSKSDTESKPCCKNTTNCCSFICNCCECDYNIDEHIESKIKYNLINLKNITEIINKITKRENNVNNLDLFNNYQFRNFVQPLHNCIQPLHNSLQPLHIHNSIQPPNIQYFPI